MKTRNGNLTTRIENVEQEHHARLKRYVHIVLEWIDANATAEERDAFDRWADRGEPVNITLGELDPSGGITQADIDELNETILRLGPPRDGDDALLAQLFERMPRETAEKLAWLCVDEKCPYRRDGIEAST